MTRPLERRKAAATEAGGLRATPVLLALADLLGGLRDDLEQVADHAEVGQLEDRRLGVLVDRDDRLRGLHAGPVLDGAGDAECDVQLRGDRLAGLPDLELVRVEAGVDGRAGRADGAAEQVGELLDQLEVVGAADAAAAGDDDRGLGQLGAGALRLDLALDDLGQLVRVGERDLDLLDRRGGRRRGRGAASWAGR